MIETVFFDLGNVVLFFSHDKLCRQVAEICSLSEEKIRSVILSGEIGDLYERGLYETKNLCEMLCDLAGKEIEHSILIQAMSNIFHPNESLISVLENLKNNGIQLILLSNTCEAHFEFAYKKYPQLQLFDHYVLSYKVGARKPEEKIFKSALKIADCPPQNCFYTDDVIEYIEGARKLGIDAEPFLNTELLVQHLKDRNQ